MPSAKSASRRNNLYAAAAKRKESEPRGQAAAVEDRIREFERDRRSGGLEYADMLIGSEEFYGNKTAAKAGDVMQQRARAYLKKRGY